MLEELDQLQAVKAFASESLDDNLSLNAVNTRGKPRNYNRGAFNRGRVKFRATTNNRNFNNSRNTHDWNNDKPYECGLETSEG